MARNSVTHRRHSRRLAGALAVALLVGTALTGCGSRRSEEDVATAMARLASTKATGNPGQTGAGVAAGAPGGPAAGDGAATGTGGDLTSGLPASGGPAAGGSGGNAVIGGTANGAG
ncbi:MAG TPA: hypothetical protein VHL53_18760, partial [Acidimicrobiia bacterium]|nr:hypothetical protein [Acidimicrobiia bacterium]